MYGMWWGGGPWGWGEGCSRRAHGPGPDAALEILRARYAKGEITRDEFEAMRRDLAAA